jgi:hypothetical protein
MPIGHRVPCNAAASAQERFPTDVQVFEPQSGDGIAA